MATPTIQNIIDRLNGLTAAIASRTGKLSDLPTVNKSTLVAAIGEVLTVANGISATISALIDDTLTTATDKTWSVDKIKSHVDSACVATKDSILGGVGTAYDTLIELATQLTANTDGITGLLSAVGNRVRFDDVQTLTDPQKAQARANIEAVSSAELAALNVDFGAAFLAATA